MIDRVIGGLRLVHPFPVTVVVVTSTLLILSASRNLPSLGFLLRALTVVFCSQVAVGALNDYRDRRIDALTQPNKPIPSGASSGRTALVLVVASLVTYVPFALSFGLEPFLVMTLGTLAGIAYDLWLKPTPFSAVPYVAGFLSLITWIWLITGRMSGTYFVVYPFGTALLVAAHLANALPDVDTDRALGQRGMAVQLGVKRSFVILVGLCAAATLAGLSWQIATSRLASTPSALFLASAGLTAAAFLWGRRGLAPRHARVIVFRLAAPAVGLLALGAVLALENWR